jgi:hypothetical protein
MDLLQEPKAFIPKDLFHQHAIGGGPRVEFRAHEDVVGTAPHDLLTFRLIFGMRCSRMLVMMLRR